MTKATVSNPVSTLSLMDLRERFGLERDRTDSFFSNWLMESEALSLYEEQTLDRIRKNYDNIIQSQPLETVVNLVVIAPLLDLAGFYQPPFFIRAEVPTRLVIPDGSEAFTGKIDVLVISRAFWVLVIESKQAQFDVLVGIPQALSYLLSQPDRNQLAAPQQTNEKSGRFGMVTNGREVVFLKLTPTDSSIPSPVYSQSKAYQVIDEEADLPQILNGLKWIGRYALGG